MTYVIKQLENVVDIVSDWAVKTIQDVTKALSPDGRPFGYVELTKEEQLREYFMLRDNAEAWAVKIGEIAGDITKKLQDSQLSPDQIMSVHPMDIAEKYLISYSAEMEGLLDEVSAAG